YILTVIAISLAAGGILNSLSVSVSQPYHAGHGTDSITGLLSVAAGVLLTLGIAWFAFKEFPNLRLKSTGKGNTVTLNVEGMNCSKCEMAIIRALNELTGILDVSASAGKGTVVIAMDGNSGFDRREAVQAIRELGYDVREGK
ncbi:MAG: cation transporter, partial [Candidatus Aegiribacteria sp.]|nr:cation transporter [Candidatus Aegiribacteria sp.]